MDDILKILDKEQSILDAEKIAKKLGKTKEEVAEKLKELQNNHTIAGYKTIINWDKTDRDVVTALIDLKVTPQFGEGFDKIAERIYKHPQVRALYLMSGSYDLSVMVEGTSMKEVALFVAQKLAPMEAVISTATHFTLKKYKEEGVIFKEDGKDSRQVITL